VVTDESKEATMQFLFLLYGDEPAELALNDAERSAIVEQHIAFSAALRERGAMVSGAGLAPSTTATMIRDGLITDGPFAETKEQIGGYYLLECADLDEALALARQVPASPGLAVEVRPVMGA